ncbi:MAG: inositol monophosphatase family protein [Wenzhouxiangellaceae bacterium]
MSASPLLQTALDAAAAARAVVLEHAGQHLDIAIKSDASPVTNADKAAERAIREHIRQRWPDHAIYGEEYGRSDDESDYLWLIDPIDGTKCFIRQLPFYSIQIALMHRGQLQLGVSCAPRMDELAWAERGAGAYLNGQRLTVGTVTDLQQAYLSTGNLKWPLDHQRWQALSRLYSAVHLARGYGDYFHYHRLAAGQLDGVLEQGVNILDIAALAVIVQEAGGVFTDIDGNPPTLETTSVIAAGTPELHQQIYSIMHHA